MDKLTDEVAGTVLVVDDDEGVRRVLARWISAMGYAVKTAESADVALEIMRDCPIDVALCDVRLPGHDGIWLVDQVRRNYPDISIVLATGLLEMDPMVTLRAGVVGYIVKPFNREELSQVVMRGMAERRRAEATRPSEAPRMLPADILEGFVVSRG